ncbi:hypothetical protein EV646_112195 [Kribbella antiqua]|uniref:Uncharacterized protein n=1 Tax=Kribbella antiqua TaxID=2512217 RepID=A0A4R2IIK0_9ACTN|nr:hypothetical protein EV646_112195 [Kribbella antiqua]
MVDSSGLLAAAGIHFAAAGWVDLVDSVVEKCVEVGLDLCGSGRELADQFVGNRVDLERRISPGTALAQR